MKHSINLSFPGGKKVDVHLDEKFVVKTDQGVSHGGEGSAPEPYSFFLASYASCAGIFALEFCKTRNLKTEELKVELVCDWDKEAHRYSSFEIVVTPPSDMPEKLKKAFERSISLCSVKKTIMNPPEMTTKIL